MDALREVTLKKKDVDGNTTVTRTYKRIPTSSNMNGKELMQILGDAVWYWAIKNRREEENLQAILDLVWRSLYEIKMNTQGCKLWRNQTKPDFPFRPVCYSKTKQTCTLKNCKNKISRLQFAEGLKESLGLDIAWCHLDMLMREIQGSVPHFKSSKNSKQGIERSNFISAMWPYVSKRTFHHMIQEESKDGRGDRLIDAGTIQAALAGDNNRVQFNFQQQSSGISSNQHDEPEFQNCSQILDDDL